MLPALPPEAICDEVFVATRRGFPHLPDLRVIERPGWLQIVTPSVKSGGLNEVKHSAIPGDDLEPVIDAAIAIYPDRGLKFRWNAGPGSAPADLGAHLERRGLAASWGRGMARATGDPLGERDRRSPSVTACVVRPAQGPAPACP
jgi:hypothetical protein